MSKKVVILTGSELRHQFFRKAIASSDGIQVLQTYCEGLEKSMTRLTKASTDPNELRLSHLAARERSEVDFFCALVDDAPDQSNPVQIGKGAINDDKHVDVIRTLNPELLVSYGCSIIKAPLLEAFSGRFLNVHLGLSPYYRGTGTNFWPLVNGEPEYVGATFMHIDFGVDTGKIIHQIRSRINPGDGPHEIGNRLILDVAAVYAEIILNFDELELMAQPEVPDDEKVYRRGDFSEEAVEKLHEALNDGLINEYLREQDGRCQAVPIVRNPGVRNVSWKQKA